MSFFVCFLYSYHTHIQSINRIKRELANLIVVITPWEMRIKKIESKSIKSKQERKKERIFFDQKKRQRCMLCMFFFVNIKNINIIIIIIESESFYMTANDL